MKRFEKAATLVLSTVALTVVAPARASEPASAEAVIGKWIDDFNKGDFKAFTAACASKAAVVDGFPPYAWTTCADWIRDYHANNKAVGATHGTLAIGKLSWSEIKGNRAYFVYPVKFDDTQQGKPVSYSGSWGISLQKVGAHWLVTGSGSAWGDTSL